MAKPNKRSEPEEIDLDAELEGLDDAEVQGRLPKIKGGRYVRLVFDQFKRQDGHNGLSYIFEFTVTGNADNGHRNGMRVCKTITGMDQKSKRDLGMATLKAILAAAFGINPAEKQPTSKLTWAGLAKDCLQTQRLTGERKATKERFAVNCDAEDIVTKAGYDFVLTNWSTWTPEDGDGEDLRQQEAPAPRTAKRDPEPAARNERKRPQPRQDDEDDELS